jgi:CheY-like chemotaxis protein
MTARDTCLLLVDDTTTANVLVADVIERELGWIVVGCDCPEDVSEVLESGARFDLALVDLSFPNSDMSGLDVLVTLARRVPICRRVVYTDGDQHVAELLRDAWEAVELASALRKTSSIATLLDTLRTVRSTGAAPIDPVLLPWLPRERSPWRSLDGYSRLVVHAGHAKLWRALIELDDEPSYQELAAYTGLKPFTVRNYRSELLEELRLHHLDRPRMRQMQLFAKRCRALLAPHIEAKLGAEPGSPS